jgi:outer membrane protein
VKKTLAQALFLFSSCFAEELIAPVENAIEPEVVAIQEEVAATENPEVVAIHEEVAATENPEVVAIQEEAAATENPEVAVQQEIAEQSEEVIDANENFNTPIVQLRASYFRPFSGTFRKLIHGGAGVNYALETTVPVWRGLNVWAAVDYFSRGGSMIGIHRTVHIMMVPITLGLKYIYWFNRYYALYGGGAGKYYFVETVNRVFPMHKTTHRDGLGSVFEIGNLFCFNHFLVDIFSSWSFKTMHGLHHLPPNATSSSMKLGGWNLGIGLGYKF